MVFTNIAPKLGDFPWLYMDIYGPWLYYITLPKTNLAHENRLSQKERLVFQPSIFRCKLVQGLVVYRNVYRILFPHKKSDQEPWDWWITVSSV